MTHISGEKSKRGEIRFSKMGIAIFISMGFEEQKECQGRERWKNRFNDKGLNRF
jgi:hypothetical protein